MEPASPPRFTTRLTALQSETAKKAILEMAASLTARHGATCVQKKAPPVGRGGQGTGGAEKSRFFLRCTSWIVDDLSPVNVQLKNNRARLSSKRKSHFNPLQIKNFSMSAPEMTKASSGCRIVSAIATACFRRLIRWSSSSQAARLSLPYPAHVAIAAARAPSSTLNCVRNRHLNTLLPVLGILFSGNAAFRGYFRKILS